MLAHYYCYLLRQEIFSNSHTTTVSRTNCCIVRKGPDFEGIEKCLCVVKTIIRRLICTSGDINSYLNKKISTHMHYLKALQLWHCAQPLSKYHEV